MQDQNFRIPRENKPWFLRCSNKVRGLQRNFLEAPDKPGSKVILQFLPTPTLLRLEPIFV